MSEQSLVHGLHATRAVLERTPARVRRLAVAPRRDDATVRGLLELAKRQGVRPQRVDPERLFPSLREQVHQGVACELSPLAPWSERDLLDAVQKCGSPPLLLALDGVQDPHNLGACLRTADACGVLAVIVPRDRAAQLNATVRKVAAGAAETTPVATVTNLVRTLRLLKDAGLWVVGTALEGDTPADQADLTLGTVVVMGAEGRGLRQLTRETCDRLVRLPQLGSVESLNVSVATGMLLYEAVRQRQVAARRTIR